MDSYWDLYVAYVNHCVEWNKKYDIDPHHYEMEWNHFLPQCIFGNQPIGHFLTLRQHAIATALQTLAFDRNCLCAWHLTCLPDWLRELVTPIYSEDKRKTGSKSGRNNAKAKVGIHSEEYKNSENYTVTRTTNGKVAYKEKIGVHSEEYMNSEKYKEDRNRGRETQRKLGVGIYAIWESTIDGWQGSAGLVARHNKLNGWDPAARVKLSK